MFCDAAIGTDPALYCDRPAGHDGRHEEKWVARWNQDDTGIEWYDFEAGGYEPSSTESGSNG